MGESQPTLLPGLVSLARSKGSEPAFLLAHHLAAAERFHRLFARAHLSQQVTMRYGPRVSQSRGAGSGDDISDMAADARKTINLIRAELPTDCAQAVIDICGYEKGIQTVEAERGWPRRSGKLVLRIGLDHLARRFGLGALAQGADHASSRAWQSSGARPTDFGPVSGR